MELIKSNSRFYYDGELRPGILLKDSGENEIKVSKFNAVKIGDRHFLLDPNVSAETFLNLQIRNGRHEYLYKSGDKIIVRDEDGNEIMPVEWIEKGMKVITAEGTGTVETFTDNIALIKSQDGLKNHYIKNLSFADTTSDFQKYRQGWQIYEKILPQIQQEIKLDNTRLLKGAFMDAFNKLDASMPKKNAPAAEPTNIETPKIEPVKVAKEDATPKVSLVSKIKNAFKKPQNVPEVATPLPTVNANHDLATPPPPQTTLKSSKPEHLGKEYTHVDESNRAGQDNHVLAHISLNPDSTNDKDKYLYHYEVGAHRDPITVNKFLNSSGDSKDEHGADITPPAFITNGVYIPGEEVINKTNGERNTVVSHIDFNKGTGALNPNNILVKDASGQTKSIPRGDVKLSSHDRTTHSVVNTDNGNKHLHDLQEGDVINHEGNKHSVLYSDPKKGLATVNQATGQMHFVSANNYHKPYLGEVKPEVKEGQQVQIGKKRFKVEHVSGEEEKGTTILSHTNKLGEKEYYEHPTNKLFDKILKPADLQEYQGDRFSPKAKPKTEESDPQKYPHADMHDIDSAQEIMELKSKHPNLTEDDIDFLKTGRGLNLKDINGMSQDEVHTILSKQPGYKAPVPDSNPMPETPLPQPVQDQQKKSRLDQITELHDNAFGEHNKTVGKDSVTHRVGIGDLAVKAGAGGTEILNKEVPIGKKKTAIIHDIDPVGKKITFRMKKDDPEDKSKYKTRSIDNFKTYVQENEELDPRADTDVRSRQVAHENDFQNKVYERVAKHLHEKGLEPSKENIDNELNTSNTGLRQSLEQYHKTYEANHNKEKAKGSIVDHPDYEKLDMDKTLSRVPNIEEKVKGELAKIKGSREEQRKKIKELLVDDIAKEYLKNGREYDEKPEVEPTQEDFDMHRKLGGTDQEVHEGVKQRMAELRGQQEHENKVQEQKEKYKQAAEEAERLSEEKKKTNKEDFLNNNYRNKSDVTEKSINNEMGLQPSKHKFDVIGNNIVDQMGFENHIVPLSSLTASHIPRPEHINQEDGAEKLPMTPNVSHPDALQGRQGYHSLDNAGNSDRKFTMDIGKPPTIDENGKAKGMRPHLLTNDSTSIDSDTPPIVERKGLAINNGRIVGLQTATPEAKQAYVDELKRNAKKMFPDANEEELHKKIDEMVSKGDLPVHVRVPVHSDGSHLSYEDHEDLTNALAKASNDPNNTKGSRDEEKIISSINALKDTTKARILSRVPPNTTLRQHIQDTGNAKKMLDDYLGDGALHPEEEKTFYDNNGKINEKGKQFLINSSKELNLDKELKDLADGNGKLGKKFDDFHNRNYEILNNIRTHNKDYDLLPHIKDALRETVADKDQLPGQEKAFQESPITKGLRYLINAPDKDGHKKINNFGLSTKVNDAANKVAEHFNKENKEYKGDYGEAGKAVQKTVADHLKEGGNDKEFHSAVSQKLKALQDYETHQKESKDALTKYKDYVTNIGKEVEDGLGLGMSADTPQQAKENAFRKYANLYDRQQKNQPKESESKPDIHPAGELIKELQNDDKSVSVENENPDNPIENKEDNVSSEKSSGDINNLPDGRFEVSEPDGGKANFTDESKAKEYSKVLKQQEELKNKFEQDEPNVIYDSKNDLSNHPEAKRYENFPDKKIVTWGQGNYKGIHPDNIMHFNQGGANSRYGRVSFIAPSEHKFKKHAQYKKLAREMRQEGKDVIINAFKNPNIVAKINKMGKSFEPEEQSYWDELRKSFEDPEPKIEEPVQMHLDTPTALSKLANTASGQQHLATLKNNGVPEEELHTTGLHNLLNTDKKIPKADIENHINNKVGKWNKEILKHPEYEQYSLPGAHTNYREVLHTYENPRKGYSRIDAEDINDKIKNHQQFVPDNYHLGRHLTPEEKTKYRFNEDPFEGSIGFQVYDQDRDERIKLAKEAHKIVKDRMGKEIEKYAKEKNVPLKTVTTKEGNTEYEPVQIEKPWGKGHYRPEGDANIIYHQRFNNRETPEGKKVTHMEEQQSDIHQAGREEGYYNEETQNKRKELRDFIDKRQEEHKKEMSHLSDSNAFIYEGKDHTQKDIDKLRKNGTLTGNDYNALRILEYRMKQNGDSFKHAIDKSIEWHANAPSEVDKFAQLVKKLHPDNKIRDIAKEIKDKHFDKDYNEKMAELHKLPNTVPDVPLKGNKWKEHGFKQALMEAVKDNSDYLSWTTGDQQFKRWGSINVNWTPHKSGEGWNVNIKGRHNDSDLSKDYHVNSLEDVKKLPGEAGEKWSEKIWDRIQKQPEGADYEPLRHGMNKEYSEVLPNIAKKHLKKFGIHPEDIELKGAGKQIYQGKEHLHSEISDVIKEIENSDRYSGYVKKLLTNTAKDLQSKRMYNQSERPFADAVEEMLESNDAPDGRVDEIIKMLHPNNRIINGSSTKVHAVKITPELREHIIKNGFSMYKSFDEFEEPLQKSNINYPERIHAMRNRRGENISSIAVMNGDKILMGRRRDSDKWTLPGGHAEEGESAEETGIRELEEETGIKAKKLESLGSEEVKNPNAPELMINCFKYETDESTSMRDDPDTEVKKWVWVSTPISQDILDNLHAKKNVTLKLLGLQNWEKSFVYQMKTAFNNLIKLLS